MTTQLNSIEEFRTKLNQVAGGLTLSPLEDNPLGQALLWLLERQAEYDGDVYLEKLESEMIYANEASFISAKMITDFLCLGKPKISPGLMASFIDSIASKALEPLVAHQKYINSGCEKCLFHHTHKRYDKLKEMKASGDKNQYCSEVEFWAVCTKARLLASQLVLKAFFDQREIAGCAGDLLRPQVEDLLNAKVDAVLQEVGGFIPWVANSHGTWDSVWSEKIALVSQGKRKKHLFKTMAAANRIETE